MSGIINSAGSKSGVIGTTELDYEEGTWTPTLFEATCTGTSYYVKIGNNVTVYGKITQSGTGGTTTGVTINNPPFNIKHSIFPGIAQCTTGLVDSGDTSSYFYINGAVNQFVLTGYPGHSGANVSRWTSGHYLFFNCTYITD